MKWVIKFYFLLICTCAIFAQDGFLFQKNQKKAIIPFQLINNLIVFEMKVNSVSMHFLLDTGVEENILFSLDDKTEVQLFDIQKIKIKGLGDLDAIEGLKSRNNIFSVKDLESKNQELVIVLDESFNFSSSLGIEVNGIIGYHFFKENLVEINYKKHKLIIYNRDFFNQKKLKKYVPIPIFIDRAKPYLFAELCISSQKNPGKLLIDTGNSDAIWVFRSTNNNLQIPDKNFDDFLGRGLSGEIYGQRAKINNLKLQNFVFENPIAAFPDLKTVTEMNFTDNRSGAIGGEICRRFNLLFDYKNKYLYLKKNNNFDQKFGYNKSGIVIEHIGLQLVKNDESLQTTASPAIKFNFGNENLDFKFKFELKPIYQIINVRKDTEAALIGLKKGDIITTINGVLSYKLTLEQINNLLKANDDESVKIEVERNNQKLLFRLKLNDVL